MANLFDQYERAASRAAAATMPSASITQPIAPGYVSAKLDDDTPIFNKQRINFDPPDPITHMCVCSSHLVMGMSTNILLCIDLDHPDSPNEVELPKSVDDSIGAMFLDPTGRHLIVSMKSGENYYLTYGAKKAKQLTKLKGQKITAIGWNHDCISDSSTDAILLGTSKGLVLETKLTSAEDTHLFSASIEQYVKQVHSMPPAAVTGLHFAKMPSSSGSTEYFIMVTLGNRLFQFIGSISSSAEPPIFHQIFSRYGDVPEHFIELPGKIDRSELCVFYPKIRSSPKSFAWMTGTGIYCGRIDLSCSSVPPSVTADTKLIQYQRDDGERPDPPLSIALTEFHVLVLFADRMKVMCSLNEQLIYNDLFTDRFGSLLGLCRDPAKQTIWAFTSKAVFKYRVIRESRNVWQIYLDENNFGLAKQHCQDNRANLDKVLTREAEYLFARKKYMESAKVYAETQTSFEEVALKFIALDDKDALKQFLMHKLQTLKSSEKMQVTMIVAWLTEIWLNQLGQLKERGEETSARYESIQETFRKFLAVPRVKDCISENRSTIYDLIASHGDIEDMIFFAVLIQDFERVISYHIQQNKYQSALELLSKQTNKELFYKFSPLLMQHVPYETVNAWIAKRDQLDPRLLIPALVQYDDQKCPEKVNEAIRYLEFCTQKLHVQDQAIHNYLLSLYAKMKSESLMKYLHMQGQEPEQVNYDLKYALRLCAEHGLQRACVHIYTTIGLYDEAVDLALQFDTELAKQNAEKPDSNQDLKKKLWLKIARHVVEEEKDIKHAMEFLQECPLLKIEDILPFFPDFVTIDNFKDAICTSLQEYNCHIEALKTEMDEATESAREIRAEIQSFRNRYAVVRSQDKCSSCGYPLMMRAFYLFPCSHRFHADCLISEVLPHLSASVRSRASDLQRRLATKTDRNGPSPTSASLTMANSLPVQQEQSMKEELDELVASECVYCGDFMIRMVDRPFVTDEDYESVVQSWL